MSGRICSAGRTVFFEAQSLGVQEHPDGAPVALDAAPQTFSFIHFDTQDGLIRSAAAIDRVVSPASYRATARSRRSSE